MKRTGIARTVFEVILVAIIVLLVANWLHQSTGPGWREHVVYSVPTASKVVALTYDDGPNLVYTRKILDILDRYHVKATFFMVGKNMDEYPDIVRDVVSRGHVVGNHTYTHPHDIDLDTQGQMIRELDRCEQVIERLTGSRAHLFRPPRGLVDGSALAIADEEGYTTILWTVCADHHDAPTPKLMAERVLKYVRPGAIILAHDGETGIRWKDVAATPLIIDGLRKRGYRFVTVPELLKMK